MRALEQKMPQKARDLRQRNQQQPPRVGRRDGTDCRAVHQCHRYTVHDDIARLLVLEDEHLPIFAKGMIDDVVVQPIAITI